MLNRCKNLVLAGVQGVSEVLPVPGDESSGADPASFLAKTTGKLRGEACAGSVMGLRGLRCIFLSLPSKEEQVLSYLAPVTLSAYECRQPRGQGAGQ